jgi:hypothetical protein
MTEVVTKRTEAEAGVIRPFRIGFAPEAVDDTCRVIAVTRILRQPTTTGDRSHGVVPCHSSLTELVRR